MLVKASHILHHHAKPAIQLVAQRQRDFVSSADSLKEVLKSCHNCGSKFWKPSHTEYMRITILCEIHKPLNALYECMFRIDGCHILGDHLDLKVKLIVVGI
jgi:hypothetical protein